MNVHKKRFFVQLRKTILHRRVLIITTASIIALFVVYFGFITKKSKADEMVFFPENCSGSWQNAAEVAGDPDEKGKLVGARTSTVGDQITCQSFSGSLPEGAVIQSAAVEFVWGIDSDTSVPEEPSVEESYDPVIPEINEGDDKTIENEPVEESTQEKNEIIPETLPSLEPTSRLPKCWQTMIAPAVHAQEEIPQQDIENEVQITPLEQLSTEENSVISENNTTATETIQPDAETSTETITPSTETTTEIPKNEVNPAFDVHYGLGESPWQSVGSLEREHLTDMQIIPLTPEDIGSLKISLTTRLTLEPLDGLVLQGVKLIITYQGADDDKDPIKQPNLKVDTILDDVTVDMIRAIRIIRAKTKKQEIWYQTVKNTDVIKSEIVLENIKEDITSEISVDQDVKISEDGQIEKITVTDSVKPSLQEQEEIKMEENLPPTVTNKPVSNKTSKTDWNLVATNELIHENSPLGLQGGLIFWFNQEGTALYSFNILTQGINTQSYQPEAGFDYIRYINEGSKEKKAILDFSNHAFIFSE